MRKIFGIILLIIAVAIPARGVDYGAIEVDVTMHPGNYRELLDRFVAADTTLTPAQMATVYYGFAFTPSYEPCDTFPEIHAAFDRQDFEEVARLVEPALQLNPVSLDLCIMGLAAFERGAGTTPGRKALNLAIRSDMLATAILESGRGTSAYNPFKVISSSDRQRILRNVLGIGRVLDVDRVGDIEAVKFLFPGKMREHILYFDNTLEENYISRRRLLR